MHETTKTSLTDHWHDRASWTLQYDIAIMLSVKPYSVLGILPMDVREELAFHQRLYDEALKRDANIDSCIHWLIGVGVVLCAAWYALAKGLRTEELASLAYQVALSGTVLSALAMLCAYLLIIRAWMWHDTANLPTLARPDRLREYYNELVKYESQRAADIDQPSASQQYFRSLTQRYCEAASEIHEMAKRRAEYVYRAKKWLMLSLIPLGLVAISMLTG